MDDQSDWPDTDADFAPFNAADYPRTYRPGRWWQALLLLVGLAMLAGGVALAAVDEGGVLRIAGVALCGVGSLVLIDAWRTRVVLQVDVVEVFGVLGKRFARLDGIVGTRQRVADGAGAPVLVLADGRRMSLPLALAIDRAFMAWLERVPDLDAEDRAALLQAVAANPRLGAAPERRLQRFHAIRRVARLALPATAGLLVWSMLAPQLPLLALIGLGAAPWFVLLVVVRSRGLLRLGGNPRDVRPNLLGVFGLACLALLPRLLTELNLAHESWLVLVPAALAAAAVLCWGVLLLLRERKTDVARWPAIVPLVAVHCAAVLAWFNVVADREPATLERTTVAYKHAGGRRALTFSLKLDPWGVHREPVTLKVSQRVFNNLSPGEAACVREHAGLWGWPWVDVQPCSKIEAAQLPAGMPEPIYRALKLRALEASDRGPLLRLLVQARYRELDEQLQEQQRRFEAGEFGGEVLQVLYRDFYDPDPDLDTRFDAWIASHPTSYPAHLARGIHRKFQAEVLHAAGYERWVSPQFNVEQYADQQLHDLERSTQLTAKPALSYAHMMDVAMHRRQREQMRQWFEQGLAVEPGSLMLRRKYLAMLRPMFGGSLREMEAFVAECRANGTPGQVLKTLEATLLMQRAWEHQHQDQQDIALALFREASALEPYGEDLAMALRNEAAILNQRRQFAVAMEVLHRALAAAPDNPNGHAMLGYALQETGRRAESVAQYRRAAELGHAPSQSYIGRLHLKGEAGVPQDAAQAGHWLRLAAADGDRDAKRLLRENPQLNGQ